MQNIIKLSWPHPDLSPNSRKDRRKTTKLRNTQKHEAWILAIEAGYSNLSSDHLHLCVTFHPPDRRKRDLDNMLGAFKSGLDGLSIATGIDDSKYELTIVKGEPMPPSGEVHVQFRLPVEATTVAHRGVVR